MKSLRFYLMRSLMRLRWSDIEKNIDWTKQTITVVDSSSNFQRASKKKYCDLYWTWNSKTFYIFLHNCCYLRDDNGDDDAVARRHCSSHFSILYPSRRSRFVSLAFPSQYTWDQFTAAVEPFASENFATLVLFFRYHYRFSNALAKFSATQPSHRSTHFMDILSFCIWLQPECEHHIRHCCQF